MTELAPAGREVSLDVLDAVQQRVLWLATSIVHHANYVRTTPSGLKVGGHQGSSASSVSILSALYFAHLHGPDRVSVKPHAAPALQAIEYLLGRLDRHQLTTLRTYGGLQSYPSRLKDPYPIDFTTGSVGLGATATIWSSLAARYLRDHVEVAPTGRQIAVIGDAELDEGVVWEALVDPTVSDLGDVLWIVDLNRQSLDRIVPAIAVDRLVRMFDAAGWNVVTLKYGRALRELFDRPGGPALQRRLDRMSNEEYQRLLRTGPEELRARLAGAGRDRRSIVRVLGDLDDKEMSGVLRDLGGHDLADLLGAFAATKAVNDQPSVILAFTIKAWGLPTEGHPANHSALLTPRQWEALGASLGADPGDPWAGFPAESPEADLCQAAARRLDRPAAGPISRPAVPDELRSPGTGMVSTQQALGRFFVDLTRDAPDVAGRVVTVSPDVASSTNLGGWINRVGVWSHLPRVDWFEDDSDTILHWRESPTGQHIELGIAEVNLVGLLAELGLTWVRDGEVLLPIGTIYDPFVNRALEPWSFGLYSGSQTILIGTPSGVSLAPEGGAHQSVITPSVGLEQPRCVAWEPAFAQDLEWVLLHALARLGGEDGTSAYLRLSTRAIDQTLAQTPPSGPGRAERRRQVLGGGYLLHRAAGRPDVVLAGAGTVMPEVIEAAGTLQQSGVTCDVICLTSADLVFRAIQARRGLQAAPDGILEDILPAGRAAPIVTVHDGHPHTLSFLGGLHGVRVSALGVADFGQSGDVGDLQRHFGIDAVTVVGAAFDLLDDT